jgi:hypothetical protein
MIPPKKPLRQASRVKSVTPDGAPPILTRPESAYLAAYRAMDDETREDAVEMVQILAKRNPRGPRLRLVAEHSS